MNKNSVKRNEMSHESEIYDGNDYDLKKRFYKHIHPKAFGVFLQLPRRKRTVECPERAQNK